MRNILDNKTRGNKKGIIGMIILFILLLSIVIIGFMGVMIISTMDYASDVVTPIMTDLGVIDDVNVNMSEVGEYTFGNVDKIVQALPWLMALAYGAALMFSLIFVLALDVTAHPVYIGFYFMLIILLIFGCVIMSNMYQDIYTGTDEIATRLQADHSMMSFMILQSPFIMAFIAIISGIIMFTKTRAGEGGFGV